MSQFHVVKGSEMSREIDGPIQKTVVTQSTDCRSHRDKTCEAVATGKGRRDVLPLPKAHNDQPPGKSALVQSIFTTRCSLDLGPTCLSTNNLGIPVLRTTTSWSLFDGEECESKCACSWTPCVRTLPGQAWMELCATHTVTGITRDVRRVSRSALGPHEKLLSANSTWNTEFSVSEAIQEAIRKGMKFGWNNTSCHGTCGS